ncbi:hypothetical protein [Histophilus somni]|nr:hypothetical protein [Histophilus somni]
MQSTMRAKNISKAKELYGQACNNGDTRKACRRFIDLDKQGVR